LTLEDIAEVLAFKERGERPCEYVLDVVQREISDLERRIKEMRALRNELIELVDRAQDLPDNGGYCQLLSHQKPTPNGA
jgi:DNA-binding transcriptional MerR regulator